MFYITISRSSNEKIIVFCLDFETIREKLLLDIFETNIKHFSRRK